MSTNESEMTMTSTEIENRRRSLKAKLYDWKKKGYSVSRLSKLIDQDIVLAEEAFKEFEGNINMLSELEEKFYHLDSSGFEVRVASIEKMLKDPERIDELHQQLITLEEDIYRMKHKDNGEAPGRNSLNLQKEIDRIREEELRKIRREESDRMRQEERKKILNHELERIREEERERLRETEVERIRKEEKERLVWEERVMRQLKQMKNKPKPKPGHKRMKCRQCGGTIEVTSAHRPLKVKCPACEKEYTLKSKSDAGDKPKIQYKKCPKCKSPIPIISEKRPFKIICQFCNSEFMLKAKKDNGAKKKVMATNPAIHTSAIPADNRPSKLEARTYGEMTEFDAERSINCPTCTREIPANAKVCGYCGTPMDAVTMGQNKMNCQSCGKQIPSDARICGFCGTPTSSPQQTPPMPPPPDMAMDDLELPLSPQESIADDLTDRRKFKPLGEYDLQGPPPNVPLPPPQPTMPPPAGDNELGGPSNMITCSQCGNLVPRGAKFCGVCGNTM